MRLYLTTFHYLTCEPDADGRGEDAPLHPACTIAAGRRRLYASVRAGSAPGVPRRRPASTCVATTARVAQSRRRNTFIG
jgi:hypothetical protein